MAEGGRFDDADFQETMDKINSGGDDDDANTTQPYQQDVASTPATRRGEDKEM